MKSNYAQQLPKVWTRVAKVCVALGDPHRQRMLLLFERDERLSIKQICEAAPLSRTAVSHHLRVLRDSGVLRSKKEGREVHFWIDKALVKGALQDLLDFVRSEY
jgi:ArsR family transcriptional regulator, arsenate/arsenite/antimonite-responsive transcriptional repressor